MWPTENPWPLMVILVCVAIVGIGQYATQRRRRSLVVALVSLLLAGGCFVLDQYVVTPAEEVIQNVYDLAVAVEKQDIPKTLNYFSPQAKERAVVEVALHQVKVRDHLRITDLSVTFKAANSLAISHFRANAALHVNLMGMATDLDSHPSRWELDWRREAGEWKIIKVRRLNPINGQEITFMSAE